MPQTDVRCKGEGVCLGAAMSFWGKNGLPRQGSLFVAGVFQHLKQQYTNQLPVPSQEEHTKQGKHDTRM